VRLTSAFAAWSSRSRSPLRNPTSPTAHRRAERRAVIDGVIDRLSKLVFRYRPRDGERFARGTAR